MVSRCIALSAWGRKAWTGDLTSPSDCCQRLRSCTWAQRRRSHATSEEPDYSKTRTKALSAQATHTKLNGAMRGASPVRVTLPPTWIQLGRWRAMVRFSTAAGHSWQVGETRGRSPKSAEFFCSSQLLGPANQQKLPRRLWASKHIDTLEKVMPRRSCLGKRSSGRLVSPC